MPSTPSPRQRRMRRLVLLGALPLLFVILGVGLHGARLTLGEYLLTRVLQRAGAQIGAVRLERWDGNGIEARLQLRFPGLKIDAPVTVDYSLQGLQKGYLDRVVLDHPQLSWRPGTAIGSAPVTMATPTIPVHTLALHEARIDVEESGQGIAMEASGRLHQTRPGVIHITELLVRASRTGQNIDAALQGDVDVARQTLHLTVHSGTIEHGALRIALGPGTLEAGQTTVGPYLRTSVPYRVKLDDSPLAADGHCYLEANRKRIGGILSARNDAHATAAVTTWEWEPENALATGTVGAGSGSVAKLGPVFVHGDWRVNQSALLEWLHPTPARQQPSAPLLHTDLTVGALRTPLGAVNCRGATALTARGETARLHLDHPLRCSLQSSAQLLKRLDGAGPWDWRHLELENQGDDGTVLLIDATDTLHARLPLHGTVRDGRGRTALSLDGTVLASATTLKSPWQWRVDDGRIQLNGFGAEGFNLTALHSRFRIAGNLMQASAHLTTDARMEVQHHGAFVGRRITSHFPLSLEWVNQTLTVRDSGCLELAWEALSAVTVRSGPARFCMGGNGDAVVSFKRGTNGAWQSHGNLHSRLVEPSVVVHAGPLGKTVIDEGMRARMTWQSGGAGGLRLDAQGTMGEARVPGFALEGRDIRWSLNSCDQGFCLDAQLDKLSQRGEHPWFRDLQVSLKGRQQAHTLRFEGVIRDPGRRLKLALEGGHDLETGRGDAVLRMDPLTLAKNDKLFNALSPEAGQYLLGLHGMLLAAGQAQWDTDGVHGQGNAVLQRFSLTPQPALAAALGGRARLSGAQLALDGSVDLPTGGMPSSHGTLLLENSDVDSPRLRVKRLNGTLQLSQLLPPRLAPRQQLAVALADLGLPLTDGLAEFSVAEGGALQVHALQFNWAGGAVRSSNIHIDPASGNGFVELQADDIDLAQLLGQLKVPGFSGTGRLNGGIRLKLQNQVPILEMAELKARGPGTLAYQPATATERSAGSVLLDALTDFRYEQLEITARGDEQGNSRLQLHVRGANPGYYNGYPVDLSLNIQGRLADLFSDALTGYQVPEVIRDRMSRFGQ